MTTTLGALLIAVVLAAALWGGTCLQTVDYAQEYPDDKRIYKHMVAALVFLDTFHQVSITYTAYDYTITNIGAPFESLKITWSIMIPALIGGFLGLIAQSFFTMRVWKLSEGNIPLTLFIALLVMGKFVLSVVYAILGWQLSLLSDLRHLDWLFQSINAVGAGADVTIAVSLMFYLYRQRRGGHYISRTMIDKLIIFCLNTGFLTSIFATLSLLMITLFPNLLLYTDFVYILGRLYTNSVLASLNARKFIRHPRGQSLGMISINEPPNNIELHPHSSKTSSSRHKSSIFTEPIAVHTTIERHVVADLDEGDYRKAVSVLVADA